jgi:hypothetical protein
MKAIPGYPGYEISSSGEIVSYKRKSPRVRKTEINQSGAECVKLSLDGKMHTRSVGHLVLLAWVGPCPPGHQCCHGPRGRLCHDLSNLCWGTSEDNHGRDRLRDGTDNRGERNGRAKLTKQIVLNVRRDYTAGLATMQQLADNYGVTKILISKIVNRKLWSHI